MFLSSHHNRKLVNYLKIKISRHGCVDEWIKKFNQDEGGLNNFSQGYKYYGLHIQSDNTVIAREWAPGAQQLYLTGDFSKKFLAL